MRKIISLLFLSIIFVFGIVTLFSQWNDVRNIINTSIENKNGQKFSENINFVLKENFWHKNEIINFYGLCERLLRKRASKDRIYYRDSSNIMHSFSGVHNFESLFRDNNWLSDYCKIKNIPYLVVQVPEKGLYGDKFSKLIDKEYTTIYIEKLKADVLSNNDLYIDTYKLFNEKKIQDKDIFFKTDFHHTTFSELTELKEIIKILQSKGVNFFNTNIVLDFDNSDLYEKITRYFIGNLSSQYGKFYVGVDEFVYYIPKFETNMIRINKEGIIYKHGEFRKSMLNGDLDANKNWRYFVTDFLNWPEPYIEIENNLSKNAPNILVFCDSRSMRAVTYLSLMCNNVTVLDPRYFNNENNYFDKIKNKQYDAIITFATCYLWSGLTYESE